MTTPAALAEQSVALLPCPFCGSDELSHGEAWPGYTAECRGLVQCHNCDAYMLGAFEQDAITAWNTRTNATDEAAQLVTLVAADLRQRAGTQADDEAGRLTARITHLTADRIDGLAQAIRAQATGDA